jgi:hypothetical protein
VSLFYADSFKKNAMVDNFLNRLNVVVYIPTTPNISQMTNCIPPPFTPRVIQNLKPVPQQP